MATAQDVQQHRSAWTTARALLLSVPWSREGTAFFDGAQGAGEGNEEVRRRAERGPVDGGGGIQPRGRRFLGKIARNLPDLGQRTARAQARSVNEALEEAAARWVSDAQASRGRFGKVDCSTCLIRGA